MMGRLFSACLAVAVLFFLGGLIQPVSAHKVNLFAYAENGKIFIESYFPDGKPAAGGVIEVLDSQNKKVAEGVTDKEGKCILPIPKKDDLTIVINASMGHKSSYILKRGDLGE